MTSAEASWSDLRTTAEGRTSGTACSRGTYSHGPVLPKNPELCDEIIKSALMRKYGHANVMPGDSMVHLAPLPDEFETLAHDSVLEKIRAGKI